MKKEISNKQLVIYQAQSGAVELRGDFNEGTIYASLNQIADLFDTDKSGVSRHIKNIFKAGELDSKRTVAKFATVQKEGKRTVKRDVEYYDLDVILKASSRRMVSELKNPISNS